MINDQLWITSAALVLAIIQSRKDRRRYRRFERRCDMELQILGHVSTTARSRS